MKKIYMLLSLAVVASGCGGRLDLPEEPDVPKAVRYELSAQVSSLSDVYVWKEGSAVGVYGSSKGDNAKYVPYNGFHGKTGLVELYGPEVDGTIYGYFPYNSEGYAAVAEGRCPYVPVQQYRTSAAGHYSANAVLVAAEIDGVLDFAHRAGLVHFSVNVDVEGQVKGVMLSSALDPLCGNFSIDPEDESPVTDAGNTVTVRGMGKPQGKFDVWFLLPAGEYEALQLVVMTDQTQLTKPVNGKVPVSAGEVTKMTVVDEAYEYTGSDFEIIGGIFD